MDWDQFADNNGLTKKQNSKYWDEEEPSFYIELQTNNIIFGFDCGKNKNINFENTGFKISNAKGYQYVKLYKKRNDVTSDNCMGVFKKFQQDIKDICGGKFKPASPTVDKASPKKQTAESKICLAETNEVNSAVNWSKVQVPDGDFWRDSAHNPWINPIWAVDAPFILQEDWEKEGFSKKCCNSQKKTKDDQIITDIFPQPYIGDPQAPFWILQINPSYSPADIFDMQKIADAQKVKEIKKEIQKEIKNNVEIFHKEVLESDGSQKEKCFLSRKKLLEQQLVFEEPHFYVLDEEFETIAETGKKLIGSYKWWKAALVGKSHLSGEDINLAKTMFFCLESLPYHSRKRGYVEALRPLTKHWGFWQKMIKYALNNDKKIFIRGQELYRLIEGLITKDNRKNIFILNPQRQYLSLGNILTVVSEQQQDELKDIVERRKNGLR